MAHELDNSRGNGFAFYGREAAWHRHGVVVPEGANAESALRLAQADFTVDRRRAGYLGEDGTFIASGDAWHAVRTDTGAILGTHKGAWRPVQPAESFAFIDAMVGGEGNATICTAGVLRGGARLFVTVDLATTSVLDASGAADKVNHYLAVVDTFDASAPFLAVVTPTRMVCANTVAVGLAAAKGRFSIRHTTTVGDKVQQARQALGLATSWIEAFEVAATAEIQTEMSDKAFDQMIQASFGAVDKNATDRVKAFASERRDTLFGLLSSPTQTNILGSVWAGEQAITEYLDHYMTVRPRGGRSEDEVKAESMWIGDTVRVKDNARSFAQSLVLAS